MKWWIFSTVVGLGIFGIGSFAQDSASGGQFEVIDVSGQVVGDLQGSSKSARSAWTKACDSWKNEMKDLNKTNQILGMNCNNPSCTLIDAAEWQCTSTGTYKVKTAGVKVGSSTVAPSPPEPPVAPPLPPEHEIAVQPPQVVIEAVPPPRVGFLWIGGYWGWVGARHVWMPGRWVNDRPGYVWSHEAWVPHGRGWRFQPGRWERR